MGREKINEEFIRDSFHALMRIAEEEYPHVPVKMRKQIATQAITDALNGQDLETLVAGFRQRMAEATPA